jgi:hypothetical protein
MNHYLDFNCPKCSKLCIYSNGDVSDCTIPDVESVKCWNCGIIAKVPNWDCEDFLISDDQTRYDSNSFGR